MSLRWKWNSFIGGGTPPLRLAGYGPVDLLRLAGFGLVVLDPVGREFFVCRLVPGIGTGMDEAADHEGAAVIIDFVKADVGVDVIGIDFGGAEVSAEVGADVEADIGAVVE